MQENETTEATATEETTQAATETGTADATAETADNQTVETAEDGASQTNAADDGGTTAAAAAPETPAEPEEEEEITYHAVQKEDSVTAIWEMQGRKHIRTIDPRSREGVEILRLFTAEEGEEAA